MAFWRAKIQVQPIQMRWSGGELSAGYLGRQRWRLQADSKVEFDDTAALVDAVLAYVFHGVDPGHEVSARAPILITLADDSWSLIGYHVMFNGWQFVGAQSSGTIGNHACLRDWLISWFGHRAERSWAVGAAPERPVPIGAAYAFACFQRGDAAQLCQELTALINQRIMQHPEAETALDACVDE
jgi:hypothetical protein